MVQTFSATEVAAIAGLDARRVRKEVEHGLFGSMSPPKFRWVELVYFGVLRRIEFELGVSHRERLYRAIAAALKEGKVPRRIQLGAIIELNLEEVVRDVGTLVRRFASWKKKLVTNDEILGGEPVFPGSRLAVRQVGDMLSKGVSAVELKEDYPYLEDEDLEFARIFAIAYPRVGRPREAFTR